jgi:hypothetical protein
MFGLLMTGGTALAALNAPYPAGFWINGTLGQDVAPSIEGYKVIFYKTINDPAAGYAEGLTDNTGKFSINEMEDMRLLTIEAVTYYIGVVSRDNFGVNQRLVTLEALDLQNGYKNDVNLTLASGEGIIDPEGPPLVINFPLRVLLKGFFGMSGTAISLEARSGNNPYDAALVDGTASVSLRADGWVISAEENRLPASGMYYLVVKHPKGTAPSIHLPIITASKIDFGSTTAVDLGTAAIYGDDRLAVEGSRESVYIDPTGVKMMWPGDMDIPFGKIDAADFSLWNGKYIDYMSNNANYNPQADLNGDGKIDAEDFSLFNGAYINFAGSGQDKHSYVPNYP